MNTKQLADTLQGSHAHKSLLETTQFNKTSNQEFTWKPEVLGHTMGRPKQNAATSVANRENTKAKTKPQFGELGTLGTLKNLTKILSYQESMNPSKSLKNIPLAEGEAALKFQNSQPQTTLNSH